MSRLTVLRVILVVTIVGLAFLAVHFDPAQPAEPKGPIANMNEAQVLQVIPGQDVCWPGDAAFIVAAEIPTGELAFFVYSPNPGSGPDTIVAFLLYDTATETLWVGRLLPTGDLAYLHSMPAKEFKENPAYAGDPCTLLAQFNKKARAV